MLLYLLLTLAGLTLLSLSAHYFILGAANIAYYLRVPPLIIGLTIVAFASSAPEMFISIIATLQDNGTIAVGNAIGSNIANIGLVLGISAMIAPLQVHSKVLNREYLLVFASVILTAFLMLNGKLTYIDSLILLASFMGVLYIFFKLAQRYTQQAPLGKNTQTELIQPITYNKAWLWLIVSLIMLPLSAQMVIQGAVFFAKFLGISEMLIGLTLVAIGTSLPEIAISIYGALKGQYDIVVGNILGSNLFNLLAVLAIPPLGKTVQIQPIILSRDMFSMFLITLLLYLVCYSSNKTGQINRWEGLVLCMSYAGYITWLVLSSHV